MIYISGADPGFFARGGGGGSTTAVYCGVDKHQIKVHSVHRIFRAIFFYFFFCLLKSLLKKKIGGREHDPPPLDPRLYIWDYLRPWIICISLLTCFHEPRHY